MGTRNLTIVILNNEPKVAQYGQWDGYPSGQGVTCLEFLSTADLSVFKERVSKLQFLSDDESKLIDNISNWKDVYPYLSRDMAADILEYIYTHEPVKLANNIDFAADSLFCEWAYVIDLDKNTFEVYVGFNTNPLENDERFAGMKFERERDEKYYPVKSLKTYSLLELPTMEQFLKDCEEPEEPEEEDAE